MYIHAAVYVSLEGPRLSVRVREYAENRLVLRIIRINIILWILLLVLCYSNMWTRGARRTLRRATQIMSGSQAESGDGAMVPMPPIAVAPAVQQQLGDDGECEARQLALQREPMRSLALLSWVTTESRSRSTCAHTGVWCSHTMWSGMVWGIRIITVPYYNCSSCWY